MNGKRLGAYRLDRELGSGGMGTVYAAVVEGPLSGLDEGTRVAVKVVHPHLLDAPGGYERFRREAEIGKAVVHENVVRTHECGTVTVDGVRRDFLVMEYVKGQTLRELLQEIERVPEELCRHIGRETAKGLRAIHAAGAIHRDIKPENVLITAQHVVKIMDLGVGRLNDESLRLSRTGTFVGSLHYAAPECFSAGGKRPDARADLHALGLVLYELASGANPYYAEEVARVLDRVLREEPRRLGDVNPQVSSFFEEVVHRLLVKDPDGRFEDAEALLRVLEGGEDSGWWKARARAIRAVTRRPTRRIRVPRETAVYGREREIARLTELYARARAGEGQVVLVEGEAGIGKSRLMDEWIARLERAGEDLNLLLGSYPPNGAATASGAFSSAYGEHFGEEGCADYLARAPRLVPAFDALLRGESGPSGEEPLTRDSLQTAFVHATRALAAERTTIVWIDDLHFAPEEGRALFSALASAVSGHRVLLLGTTRPGVDERRLSNLTRMGAERISLSRLGSKDVAELLLDALKSERTAQDLVLDVLLKSDGNPFFVFEILRGLREGRFIAKRDDGTWTRTGIVGAVQIPSSVLDLVNARVADLTSEERDLLDVACCWGFEFDATLVGDALGEAPIPTLKRFAQIERKHRLVRCSGERFVFDHHQVQEALYGAVPPQLARRYHAALAEALERRTGTDRLAPEALAGQLCVDLCEHSLRGDRGPEGLRYLDAALDRLGEDCLDEAEIRLTERALAVPDLAGADRVRTLLRLCRPDGPLDRLGLHARQEEIARDAEALAARAGDESARARAAASLGHVGWKTSRHADAEAAFRRAIEVARACGEPRTEGLAWAGLGNVQYAQGRFAEAHEGYERALSIDREVGDRAGEADVTAKLGYVFWSQGRLADARAQYERALELDRAAGDRAGEARDTGSIGIVLSSEGRLVEARDRFDRALSLNREIGYRQGEAAAMGNLGIVSVGLGRLSEAKDRFERALALSREFGNRRGEAVMLHNLGSVFREQREIERAEDSYRACLALCTERGFQHVAAEGHLALGALRADAGDLTGAREAFATARSLASAIGVRGVETLACCHQACLPTGDAGDAATAYRANEERLGAEERREACWLLWRASGDPAHLAEARRLLEEALSMVPSEHHEAMRAGLLLHRRILTAAKETLA